MRPFTPRKRTCSTRTSRVTTETTLQKILTGPDTPHRREIETMLEEAVR